MTGSIMQAKAGTGDFICRDPFNTAKQHRESAVERSVVCPHPGNASRGAAAVLPTVNCLMAKRQDTLLLRLGDRLGMTR